MSAFLLTGKVTIVDCVKKRGRCDANDKEQIILRREIAQAGLLCLQFIFYLSTFYTAVLIVGRITR